MSPLTSQGSPTLPARRNTVCVLQRAQQRTNPMRQYVFGTMQAS